MSEPRREVRLDPTTLRGLAHPLRLRILGQLRENGPATATTLADRLGQSTGATSYHLRQLATYGFVVEDPERNVGRERWWKAAHDRTILDVDALDPDAEGYMRAVAAQYAERVDRWVAGLATIPPAWLEALTLSDWRLRLTPAEGERLKAELSALAERYRQDGAGDPPDGAERVVLQVHLMPFPADAHRPDA
jgi:DNA-binding transcriptional ArsR family regulator